MPKKISTADFIEKAMRFHGNLYDYSSVIYVHSRINVIIKCSIHGEFLQTPTNHMTKNGCPKCSNNKKFIKIRMSNEEFILRSNLSHNNYYDYQECKYETAKKKVTIGCPIHGFFQQEAHSHLWGAGCRKCSIIKVAAANNGTNE